MGLFSTLREELVDIIEWLDHTRDTLVWRFPRYRNEIKNGAQLIVRPGQVAVFVHQGELADVFQPGTHTLETANLPVLSRLQGWKYGFESPFKSEVYFVNTRQIVDLKWGTPNPITIRDPEFGPIRLRAFGTYTLQATDPRALLRELVGTDDRFEADEIHELLRGMINSSLSEVLGQGEIPAIELSASYSKLAEQARLSVVEKVDDEYGLDIPVLVVVNVSFPEEVEKALDARSSMSMIGDMNRYQRYQLGQSMPMAAQSGGESGNILGLGLGMAMAQGFGGATAQPQAQAPAPSAAPPPLPQAASFFVAVNGQQQGPYPLEQVKAALAAGQISGDSLVWSEGMAAWTPASQVPQLQSSGGAPPPLPGSPPAT
ncbi:MAG: SPFH domain-containing protein [Acidobacteriota bacterium]